MDAFDLLLPAVVNLCFCFLYKFFKGDSCKVVNKYFTIIVLVSYTFSIEINFFQFLFELLSQGKDLDRKSVV